jgi:hypothetical protein
VQLGADGITTTCGFLSLYQREIASHVGVPVATSSLMQIPFIERILPPGKRVGVLTVSAASLLPEHMIAAGADPKTPVVGTDNGTEFTRCMVDDMPTLDAAAAERDILDAGDALVAAHPIPARWCSNAPTWCPTPAPSASTCACRSTASTPL